MRGSANDERALTSTLPPLLGLERAARVVCDAVAGFGPLQRYLDDPGVGEVWITGRLPHGSRWKR
jgi:pilus assembly protein CpaF